MGVLHLPQKTSESYRPSIDENQTNFIVFGGMSWTDQKIHKDTYLLTLTHNSLSAYLAKLPAAQLPSPDVFRGNASLTL